MQSVVMDTLKMLQKNKHGLEVASDCLYYTDAYGVHHNIIMTYGICLVILCSSSVQ